MGFAGYDVHCRICILKVAGSEFKVCRNEIVGKETPVVYKAFEAMLGSEHR
jgi:hypothetical protein